MKSEHLKTISLIIALLGTLLLITLAEYSKPPFLQINEITEEHLERKVTLQTKILSIRNTEEVSLLTLADSTGTIKAVAFDILDLKTNSQIEIEGTIEEYQGELEILIDKINLLE